MSFIGIDFGGSFIKGGVLDSERREVRDTVRAAMPGFKPHPYRREAPIADVLKAGREMLDALIAKNPDARGIAISTQMHGHVLCDAKGKPASDFVAWQDSRSLHEGGAWERYQSLSTPEERRATGLDAKPGHPVASLQTYKDEAKSYALSLGDFFAAALGGKIPAIHATNAAAMGFYDLKTGQWHRGLIQKLGLERFELGKLPVFCALGDQQAALLGCGVTDPAELSLNVATGSQASRVSPQMGSDAVQTRPYFDGNFLLTQTHLPAGRSLNALIELFQSAGGLGGDPWSEIERLVDQVPHAELKIDLAFFPGAFGGPGRLENISEESLSAGQVFAAAFEAMTQNYLQAARKLFVGEKWSGVAISGGLVQKSKRLQTLIAREISPRIRYPRHSEDTLMGLLAHCMATPLNISHVKAAQQLHASP